jgi:Helix-turn-helix domain
MRELILSDTERAQLAQVLTSDPKAYRRERAAALLKIAAGQPAAQVARHGLLRRRKPDTVYAWMDRYLDAGLAGLTIRPGRGRKVPFPPLARAARRAADGPAPSGPPRPAAVRGDAHALDAGGDPAGLRLAGQPHAVGGVAVAGPPAYPVEARAGLYP